VSRLRGTSPANTVPGRLQDYVPLFQHVAVLCGTRDARKLDKALFSYRGNAVEKSGKQRP
jgi:hypothetical protein